MENLWNPYLERHFPGDAWKRFYNTIIFYTVSVNAGLKPSFMWDFGPLPTSPRRVLGFIQDLKRNNVISKDILVVLLRCRVFVGKIPSMLRALENNTLIIDISSSVESGWFLGYRNDFVVRITDAIIKRLVLGDCYRTGQASFNFPRHFPTVYGLLLEYPFTYYTDREYPPISFDLRFYRVTCKFRFDFVSQDFPLYEFSIPKSLISPLVITVVNNWFERLLNRNRTGFELVLDEWEEFYEGPWDHQ